MTTPSNWITPEARRAIYERDRWTCQICGRALAPTASQNDPASPTIDHIIPRSAGGSSEPDNLQATCRPCNSGKRDYTGRAAAPDTRGTISEAVIAGSRLDVLLAMRLHIAKSLDDGASPRDLAALTKRLSDIDFEVRALQAENDPVSEAADIEADDWAPDA